MIFIIVLLFACASPLSAMEREKSSVPAKSSNRNSADSRLGSILQARHAREISDQPTPLNTSQAIKSLAEEQQKNPKFKEVMQRTELMPRDELDKFNARTERKFKKLKHMHNKSIQSYGIMQSIFSKILMLGTAINAAGCLCGYPQQYEKDLRGAGIGIAVVGAFGLSYSLYKKNILENQRPIRAQAIQLILDKERKKMIEEEERNKGK